MTRVDITTAGHTITIDADEPLDTVAVRALALWSATRFGRGDAGTTDGAYDQADADYASGHDGDLGFRMETK